MKLHLLLFTALQLVFSQTNEPSYDGSSAHDMCTECKEYGEGCFNNFAYCFFDKEEEKFWGDFEYCNTFNDCASCFPDAVCNTDNICPECKKYGEGCFNNFAYCFFDKEEEKFSGDFEDCNVLKDCAQCFPDAKCGAHEMCTECKKYGEGCFNDIAYCFFDKEEEKFWGDFKGCNTFNYCASCFPDAVCNTDNICPECKKYGEDCFNNDVAYCFFDKEEEKFSGDFEDCNVLKDCAQCFPDAKCDGPTPAPVQATTSAPVKAASAFKAVQ